jgi:DNA-binding transcriptional MerR regulator
MKLQTISQVAKDYHISTRTLRYYEQIGLLPSTRLDDYAYRVYDEGAIKRLEQIVVLRKLRISLKQIAELLSDVNVITALAIFEANVLEINAEINALSTVRGILETLIERINDAQSRQINFELLSDETLLAFMDTVSLKPTEPKEVASMDDLKQSDALLSKLKNVRVLFLPPMTVAASHYFGKNPEEFADIPLHEFIRTSGLADLKPDLRVFGFNNPCDPDENGQYGYEFWVTIPEEMEVPAPMIKKHFAGGLYGAHTIQMGNFNEWQQLFAWASDNETYNHDIREPLGMQGSLEEHLNAYHYYKCQEPDTAQFTQVDLLIPIREK